MNEIQHQPRKRIDRLNNGLAHRHRAERPQDQAASGPALGVDAPVFALVVLSPEGAAPNYAESSVLGAAKRLQMYHAPEQAVAVLVFGQSPVDPAAFQARGADLVLEAQMPGADPLLARSAELALAQIDALAPAHVLIDHRAGAARALTLTVAAGLGAPVALAVRHLDIATITTQSQTARPGQVLEQAATRLIELQDGSSEPWVGPCREARCRSVFAPQGQRDPVQIDDLGQLAGGTTALRLDEAEFIVSGGAGINDWALFRDTVAALGAAPGASRVAVDAGHAPRETQVGSSGAIVQAKCYLALGISGAPQHLEGIARCDQVIAVNTDPNCAMMRRADLAIEGDAQAVMRALVDMLAEDRGGSNVA